MDSSNPDIIYNDFDDISSESESSEESASDFVPEEYNELLK